MNLQHRSEASSVSLVRIRSVKHGFVAGPRMIGFFSWSVGIRGFLLCVVALAAFFGIAGCSTNAAKPDSQTPLISVAISQAPPSSLILRNSAQASATVTTDLAT